MHVGGRADHHGLHVGEAAHGVEVGEVAAQGLDARGAQRLFVVEAPPHAGHLVTRRRQLAGDRLPEPAQAGHQDVHPRQASTRR